MADTKISDLTSGTAPEDADQFAVARSASNRKLTWANLKAALSSLYATAAQGALADSAVQPEDLGTAASTNASAYATAAQGAKADTAAQVAGDLGGTAASPTVAKINGLTLPENPSTAGYSLQWNGAALVWAAGAGGLPSGLTYSSNVFEQRNSTAAQAFNLYNTYSDGSNYERGAMAWSGNVLRVGAEAAGTGTVRPVTAVGAWTFQQNVVISNAALFLTGAEAYINAGGGNIATSGSAYIGVIGGAFLQASSINVMTVCGSSLTDGAALELREQDAPAAGAANTLRVFAADDGSGNTVLRYVDSAGTVHTITAT